MADMSVETLQTWVPSNTFATRLILVRRELGLNVKQAAKLCGVHYATWSTWENGRKPNDMGDVVERISQKLRVDREWLMWGQTSRDPRPPTEGEVCAIRDSNPEP